MKRRTLDLTRTCAIFAVLQFFGKKQRVRSSVRLFMVPSACNFARFFETSCTPVNAVSVRRPPVVLFLSFFCEAWPRLPARPPDLVLLWPFLFSPRCPPLDFLAVAASWSPDLVLLSNCCWGSLSGK